MPGAQADLVGHSDGSNLVRLQSEAVGRGITVEVASLLIRNAVLGSGDTRMEYAEIAGAP